MSRIFAIVAVFGILASLAIAQPTAFNYQGSLADSGGLANGLYDFEFTIHTALTGGAISGTDEHLAVLVTDGLFNVDLDFGSTPFGSNGTRFLQVAVKFNGDPTYTTIDPRIPLNSVPYAILAKTATVALSGPFEPIDNTPTSSSGTSPQTLSYSAVLLTGLNQNIDIKFPITINRQFFFNGFTIQIENFDDFTIEISTAYDQDNQWQIDYQDRTSNVDIEIQTTTLQGDLTQFLFRDGTVTGYRLDYDSVSHTLREVLTVTYGSPAVPFQNPLKNTIQRNTNGYSKPGPGPFSPYLGGTGILPGLFTYTFDGFSPPHTNIGSLPNEKFQTDGGFLIGSSQSDSIIMLHNVFSDRFNTMWNEFTDTLGIHPIEIRDSTNNLVWLPQLSPNTPAGITSWTLDMADDGGLFESYQFDYDPDPSFP